MNYIYLLLLANIFVLMYLRRQKKVKLMGFVIRHCVWMYYQGIWGGTVSSDTTLWY